MSQMNSSMNFLPEDYVEKRQASRAAVVFIGLLLLVVGGLVGAYLFTQHHMKAVFEQRDRVNAAYEDAAKQIAAAEALEKQEEEMVRKAEITTTLMERVERSVLLKELATLSPKDAAAPELRGGVPRIGGPPMGYSGYTIGGLMVLIEAVGEVAQGIVDRVWSIGDLGGRSAGGATD